MGRIACPREGREQRLGLGFGLTGVRARWVAGCAPSIGRAVHPHVSPAAAHGCNDSQPRRREEEFRTCLLCVVTK